MQLLVVGRNDHDETSHLRRRGGRRIGHGRVAGEESRLVDDVRRDVQRESHEQCDRDDHVFLSPPETALA
jgi:hypothetical protein